MNRFDAADGEALAAVRSALDGGVFLSAVVSIRRAGSVARSAFGAALLGIEPDGPPRIAVVYSCTGFLLLSASAWRSLSADATAIVLTNRVYYGREETAEKIAAL